MYDEIIVKKDLPLPEEISKLDIDWKNYVFQTKSLENCLLEYFIDEDGYLNEIQVEREYVDFTEEEKKTRKKKKEFFPIWKDVVEKSRTNKRLDFHGKITFYTYEDLDDKNDFTVDFDAFFVYGKLDKIQLVDFQKYESRKIRNEKWQEKLEIFNKKYNCPTRKIKLFLSKYSGWRFFWRKIGTLLYIITKNLNSLQYIINRHFL